MLELQNLELKKKDNSLKDMEKKVDHYEGRNLEVMSQKELKDLYQMMSLNMKKI